jgi:putative FmdB family regulatory protein
LPNYEYRCSSCQNQYEKHEGFDAPARQPCPKCGAEAKRLLFAPPIVFKGSGFYITDSRKGSSASITSDGTSPSPSPAPASSPDSAPASSAASSDD